MDPEKLRAVLEALTSEDPAAAAVLVEEMLAEAEAAAAEADAMAEDVAAEVEASAALQRELLSLARAATPEEALGVLRDQAARLARLDEERAAVDAAARRGLVGELVKLGAETPATAWEGEPDARTPCQRLAVEGLESMRARVAALRLSRAPAVLPPRSDSPADEEGLTETEARLARNMTADARERFVAMRRAHRGEG